MKLIAAPLLQAGSLLVFLLSWSTAVASPLRGRNLGGHRLPGTGNYNVTGEIYGGSAAAQGEFPAYALLCYGVTTGCGGCGGALVASQYVLTAAHCVTDANGNSLGVTGVRVSASQTQSDGTYVAVTAITDHPNYIQTVDGGGNLQALRNDVSVLTLASAISGVTPMSYNRDSAYPANDGTSLVAIGYGRHGTSNSISTFLRKTTLSFLTDASCSSALGGTAQDDEVICAQGTNTGACKGDSGGPLLDTSGLLLGMWSFVLSDCGVSATSYNWAADNWNYASWIDEQTTGAPTQAPACDDENCFTIAWKNLVSFWDSATTALEASASRLGFGDEAAV